MNLKRWKFFPTFFIVKQQGSRELTDAKHRGRVGLNYFKKLKNV